MVPTDRQGARHAALASEPRRRVLGLLTAAAGPLDAVTVSTSIGLHVTTARFHLEQLEAAGLVERRIHRARSVRAGERWSEQYPTKADAAGTELMPLVLRVLDEIGFEPELQPDGVSIALPACPFRAEARQNPDVVCSVHLGLLRGLATSLGHDGEHITLRPFVQPQLCSVHLTTPAP
jgi:predicted ArsR family transcriptional regulator